MQGGADTRAFNAARIVFARWADAMQNAKQVVISFFDFESVLEGILSPEAIDEAWEFFGEEFELEEPTLNLLFFSAKAIDRARDLLHKLRLISGLDKVVGRRVNIYLAQHRNLSR